MAGPYPLTPAGVEEGTRPGWPGVYKLYHTVGGPVRYVGRSDSSVRKRLMQHVGGGKYSFYWVRHLRDPVDAFLTECGLWHRHINDIDNHTRHPDRPSGCGDACPSCHEFG